MKHTVKELEKSQVEVKIVVTPEEYAPAMEKAAQSLSNRVAIKGFRKGHVPYDVLKKEVGEMAILQEAMEDIVQRGYIDALKEEKLDTIGMPQINLEKAAPGNDVEFTATVALLPEVTLPDVKKIKVTKEVDEVNDEKLQETIDALRGMHAVEVEKDGKAEGTDKLVLDMDMMIDNVPVEGGQAKDYQVYLSEDHYIPGFNKQVEGMKQDEEKEFTLDFPKNHYQKNLAGKSVDFKVKVKDVFERQLPEMDEEFAKKLGQESIETLKGLIKSNLVNEAEQKAEQKFEVAILENVIEKAKFGELPDVLVNAERERIFMELKRDLEKHGVGVDQYLADLKKTEEELRADFTKQAEQRAKAALVSRQVALEQDIRITDEEIEQELEMLRQTYAHNKEAQDNLKRPEVRDSIATTLQNKKVMAWLKEHVGGKKEGSKKEKSEKKSKKKAKK